MRPRSGSWPKPFAAPVRFEAVGRSLILHELNEDGAINDNLVASFEAVGNIVLVSVAITQSHVLPRKAAVGLDDIDERQILIVAQDGRNGSQQARALLAGLNAHADVHLFLQKVSWIVDHH